MSTIIHSNLGPVVMQVKPATGPRSGDPAHMDAFYEAYLQEFYKGFDKNPSEYGFAREDIPVVAEKMMRSLASGGANLSDNIKKAAKSLGVHPTMGAISAYLNGREAPEIRRKARR